MRLKVENQERQDKPTIAGLGLLLPATRRLRWVPESSSRSANASSSPEEFAADSLRPPIRVCESHSSLPSCDTCFIVDEDAALLNRRVTHVTLTPQFSTAVCRRLEPRSSARTSLPGSHRPPMSDRRELSPSHHRRKCVNLAPLLLRHRYAVDVERCNCLCIYFNGQTHNQKVKNREFTISKKTGTPSGVPVIKMTADKLRANTLLNIASLADITEDIVQDIEHSRAPRTVRIGRLQQLYHGIV